MMLILTVIAITTVSAYLLGQRIRRRPVAALSTALTGMFECVGACVLFLLANVAVGVSVVLAARSAGWTFASLYAVNDVTLVVLAVLQGLFFRFWWRSSGGASPGA